MENKFPTPNGSDDDKDVKKYFIKILYSISWGVVWIMVFITLGIYNELAFIGGKPVLYNILFYVLISIALIALIRYYYKNWNG